MRPVISVSLNGRAYQLEDDAHERLANYLDVAARSLGGNPDRVEILADLEQAIADKCERYLTAHKTVLSRGEIEQVVREMGPVDPGAADGSAGERASGGERPIPGDAAGAASSATGADTITPKRLYQISDGAMISGVCKGVAVYLDADVTVIRLLFVLAAVLTGGLAVFGYIAMMFLVPYANTLEEHAAARGVPFNARVLVEQAKLKAAQLAGAATHAAMGDDPAGTRAAWRAEWRWTRAQWRREWRHARAQWRGQWRAHRWAAAGPVPPPPLSEPPLARLICGLMWLALGLMGAVLGIVWILALISLITTGAVFGWMPFHQQLWVAVMVLLIVYLAVAWPLRAMRHALAPQWYGHAHPWHVVSDSLAWLVLLVLAAWYLSHHGQDVQNTLHTLQQNMQPAWQQLALAWRTLTQGVH